MSVEEIVRIFSNHPLAKQINEAYQHQRLYLKGLKGSATAFWAAAVIKNHRNSHLFLLNDKEDAAYLYNDLQSLLGTDKVLYFPSAYRHPYQEEKTDNANVLLRAEVLNKISKNEKSIVVTYAEAVSELVVTKKNLKKNTLQIHVGDCISIDFINEVLFDYEFERVDFVYEPGQFSVRGGIVDIFSFSNEYPYRIEFFGDEVESVRTFDPETQLSVATYKKANIIPNIQSKLIKESRESFLEFLPPSVTLWIQDANLSEEILRTQFEKVIKAYDRLSEASLHLKPEELYLSPGNFQQLLKEFYTIEWHADSGLSEKTLVFNELPQPHFHKNFELLIEHLKENTQKGYKNFIFFNNTKQIERINQIFEDLQADVEFTPVPKALHEGFIEKDVKAAFYTDHQIFERYHRFRLKEGFKKNEQALTIKELTQLQPGDYVVHIDHGVGQFDGLETIEVNGKKQEAVRILYKDGDLLYVSVNSLHRISKYSSKEGHEPSLHKLGGKAWQTLKKKTKKRVKEIAFDLIRLYAERKAAKGFQFSPDTYLQTELEASFIYEDTPDQMKATEDVKKDMEAPYPMDRLICGDVGFGKTEIAIRAAFKAVADNKQVVVLVPTTILALQHYKTFSERLKNFPCTIDYINRFKSSKQQKETLKKLAEGKIDIIIGTHRLLGKDVKFKDLGLLIIDEEQKFGVSAKDKLKTIKVNVDTLTLTATPIPRTLQFSLMGARDMSIIKTPPPNRFPVQTEIHGLNETVIRDAINYELSRGGQVFFVHNRIQNIGEVAAMIKRLVPDAKVEVAHGQMPGEKLEEIMMAFMEHEFDVLVSTTIIESGLDIPNANTIIINRAHTFGLSDLHQMRGRVGRSNRKAFCYLLSPPLSSLPSDARKRLRALEQFSDLGSGFNIAMRDLDIRGAGDLLGAEQSGFINEIGMETFQKILDETIQELKENEFKDLFKEENQSKKVFVTECVLDTDEELLIPNDYINNVAERLTVYKALDELQTDEEIENYIAQLTDRFGPVPFSLQNFITGLKLRNRAKKLGFEKIVFKSEKLLLYFVSDSQSPYYQSETFGKLIQYISSRTDIELKQKGEKLYLLKNKVSNLHEAKELIEEFSKHLLFQAEATESS
ncbi:MAG: transcription-repair coupling factor [Bacteroidetes bacterium]|nr:MAG: transcription-repair coupling factor [Bacteroidota bacterium]